MRGGARPGAGRKPGSANKVHHEARVKALTSGLSPLDYLLGVMRDNENDAKRRDWAAAAAAPYVHARRASVEDVSPPPPNQDRVSPLERARRVAFALVNGLQKKAAATVKEAEKNTA